VAGSAGDEFVLLLENLAGQDQVVQLADKVIESLASAVHGQRHQPACRLQHRYHGLLRDDGLDAVSLLKNADAAMYKVKELGRTDTSSTAKIVAAVLAQLNLENALRLAVRQQQFALHYQPIIDLEHGGVVAVEALIRWQRADDDPVMPDQFIPVAEETRLIVPLGRWVARTAISQFRQWAEAGWRSTMSRSNVSAAQVFHRDFATDLIGFAR